jgi:hypothetical protein
VGNSRSRESAPWYACIRGASLASTGGLLRLRIRVPARLSGRRVEIVGDHLGRMWSAKRLI